LVPKKGHQGHQPKTVKITKICKNGREMWRLNIPVSFGGTRKRKFFETRVAAEVWISKARQCLRETGNLEPVKGVTVSSALDDYLEAKSETGGRHKTAMLRYAKLVRKSFGPRLLESVSVLEFNKWLNRPEWSAASRATARRYCLGFWNWCVRNELIERNRLLGSEVQGGTKKEMEVLPVDKCRALLEATEGRMRAFVVLQMFCGLRTCEAMAATIDWLSLEDKELVVYEAKRTTGIPRRTVRLREAFMRWWPEGVTGKVWQKNERNWRVDRRQLFANLGWNLPQNTLRHTFASYLLAKERSAAMVALELGHASEAMVRNVYGHAVKAKAAEAFWQL
jgi:integrase